MYYGDHNFIEITQQTKLRVEPVELDFDRLGRQSRARRGSRAVLFDHNDTAKIHGLDTSNVSSRVVSCRAKWNLGFSEWSLTPQQRSFRRQNIIYLVRTVMSKNAQETTMD